MAHYLTRVSPPFTAFIEVGILEAKPEADWCTVLYIFFAFYRPSSPPSPAESIKGLRVYQANVSVHSFPPVAHPLFHISATHCAQTSLMLSLPFTADGPR